MEWLIDGCWRSIRVSVSTISWSGDVRGSKSRMEWGVKRLLRKAIQVLTFSSTNNKNGDGNQEKYSKSNSNANDCPLWKTTLVGGP